MVYHRAYKVAYQEKKAGPNKKRPLLLNAAHLTSKYFIVECTIQPIVHIAMTGMTGGRFRNQHLQFLVNSNPVRLHGGRKGAGVIDESFSLHIVYCIKKSQDCTQIL